MCTPNCSPPDPDAIVKIDLPNQTLTTPSGRVVEFPVDAFSKHCLVKGVDELGYILEQDPEIAAYEARTPRRLTLWGSGAVTPRAAPASVRRAPRESPESATPSPSPPARSTRHLPR